jgi:hypothetical protein
MATKYGDAVFMLMTKRKANTMTTRAVWTALAEANPELVLVTEGRKTPRTTAFRDLRKDSRFIVKGGSVTLSEDKKT